jgi:phospholipid/cholesterol/gamma-HCH transport system permease protein
VDGRVIQLLRNMDDKPAITVSEMPLPGSMNVRIAKEGDTLTVVLSGRLDMNTTGNLWRETRRILQQSHYPRVVIDMSDVSYCDGAGIAFIDGFRQHQTGLGGELSVVRLDEKLRRLFDIYGQLTIHPPFEHTRETLSLVEQIGRGAYKIWQDCWTLVTFTGELAVTVVQAVRNPRRIRWQDTWLVAEQAGVNALPIILLIGLLLGLILAFQAAMPMRQFGADIYVANLIGVSMLREMGALITAIILAGRSGSAFAAELGTMNVREEIDALKTMGLEPVRFLVLPRVLAAVTMTPLLTVFANLAGLIGGAVVMSILGFPLVTYVNQVLSAVTVGDFLGGLFKALCFGIVVSAIGCLRGLEATRGASGIGQATTRAVVSGIVLIAILDGVFAVLFYALGW